MFTPWIIAAIIVAILLKAAFNSQRGASNSVTFEGKVFGLNLMYAFAVAALVFVLAAVVLTGN